MLHIHRPTLHDLNECAKLDANYTTQRVWQMTMQSEATDIQVSFHLVYLPRQITIANSLAADNLLRFWQRGDCLLAARLDSEIVGYLHMIPDKQTGEGYIYRHVVSPEHRRQGIGTALLNHALRWGQDRKLRSVLVTLHTKNYPASNFYVAHGFAFCGFTEQSYKDQQIQLHFSRSIR